MSISARRGLAWVVVAKAVVTAALAAALSAIIAAIIAVGVPFDAIAAAGAVAPSSSDVAAAPPQFVQQLGAGLPLRTPLRDAAGRNVLLSDYFGGSSPVLLVFGYYRCRSLCNVVFDDVLQALALSGAKDYRLLGVSIDPTEGPADAAARLAGWRRALSDQPAPILLTGDAAPLAKLARTAGFQYRYDARQGQYEHPAGFLIVTPNGTIANYFLGLRYDPAALRAALALAGQGGTGGLAEQVQLVCAAVVQLAGVHSGSAMRIVQAAGAVTLALLAALVWTLARRGRAA